MTKKAKRIADGTEKKKIRQHFRDKKGKGPALKHIESTQKVLQFCKISLKPIHGNG
jgi:hypothetical protein